MNQDTIDVLLTFLGIIVLAICLIVPLTFAVAWTRTRAWQKAQVRSSTPSSSPFLPSKQSVGYTDDLSDSEIEDNQAAERELHEDVGLTTRQKFWKEFGMVWNDKRIRARLEREKRQKEREERRKLAREVAREMRR